MSISNKLHPPAVGFFAGRDLTALAREIRAGSLTSVALVKHALDGVEKLNPALNAFAHVARDKALEEAMRADRELAAGIDKGPLHGIPVGIKDNISTAGVPMTMGSAHFNGYVPDRDAACVAALRKAGAIIFGKTTTHEFAYGPTGDCAVQGATRNPWDTTRIPGGSSCGSAVAVAAGILPVALGTDTGGSVRIPAALTGVVGFKPSYARIPMDGVFPLSKTLDHVGVIAGSAADAAVVSGILFAPKEDMSAMAAERSLAEISIAWVPPALFEAYGPAVERSVYEVLSSALEKEPPVAQLMEAMVDDLRKAIGWVQKSEAYEVHAERIAEHPELFQPEVLERLLASCEVRGWEYVRGMALRQRCQALFGSLLGEHDFLAMPTVPLVAPRLYERLVHIDGRDIPVRDSLLGLTNAWNLLGFPAISIPCGTVEGLPIGLQLVGGLGRDEHVLEVARLLEKLSWTG
ncbi:amidase [Pseudomonas citronellolis]|uniref:amidase n=1 Tax=Pseudomonas citronellolis TaxID=53408 RepID=UPI0018D6B7C5|nr:amidase [Pseudomonas citronellolis]MBH3432739.1 amidase [Pseudomonas citronellolis]